MWLRAPCTHHAADTGFKAGTAEGQVAKTTENEGQCLPGGTRSSTAWHLIMPGSGQDISVAECTTSAGTGLPGGYALIKVPCDTDNGPHRSGSHLGPIAC